MRRINDDSSRYPDTRSTTFTTKRRTFCAYVYYTRRKTKTLRGFNHLNADILSRVVPSRSSLDSSSAFNSSSVIFHDLNINTKPAPIKYKHPTKTCNVSYIPHH